jgi:hypothetical protein
LAPRGVSSVEHHAQGKGYQDPVRWHCLGGNCVWGCTGGCNAVATPVKDRGQGVDVPLYLYPMEDNVKVRVRGVCIRPCSSCLWLQVGLQGSGARGWTTQTQGDKSGERKRSGRGQAWGWHHSATRG